MQYRSIADDGVAMSQLAREIGQDQLERKKEAAKDLLRLVIPRAESIWGRQVVLKLHGSRAKNTFIDDSDFDYHIENTIGPITQDEMCKFRDECCTIPNVSARPKIKLALCLQYTVPRLEDGTLHFEFIPERADYLDASGTSDPFIEAADTYFLEHPCACHAVRLLKHLFQRTQPRLKACALEQLVQQVHSEKCIQDLARWRDDPTCTRDLFLSCLKVLESQPRCEAMARLVSEVYPDGLPNVSVPSGIALSEVRRDPELHLL